MLYGAKSSVLMGIEETFGTAATLAYKLPFTNESLNQKIEALKSEANLGLRAPKSLAPGKEGAAGSIEVELYPELAGVLFYLALGKASAEDPDSTPDSGDEYSKIVAAGVNDSLPSATIQVDHAGQKFDYLGMKLNQLQLNAAVGAIPKVSLDWLGKEEADAAATIGSLTEPGNEPFYFREIAVYTDEFTTVTDKYSNIQLTIANNLDGDDYRLDGTGKRKSVAAQNLDITGSVELIFDASTVSDEYAKFKNFTDAALALTFEKNTQKLRIYLPRIRFSEATHDISGAGKILLKANITALLDSNNEAIIVEDHVNTSGTY